MLNTECEYSLLLLSGTRVLASEQQFPGIQTFHDFISG